MLDWTLWENIYWKCCAEESQLRWTLWTGLNLQRIGTVVINQKKLDLFSFEKLACLQFTVFFLEESHLWRSCLIKWTLKENFRKVELIRQRTGPIAVTFEDVDLFAFEKQLLMTWVKLNIFLKKITRFLWQWMITTNILSIAGQFII